MRVTAMTTPEETARFEVHADVASHFAWLRTRLAVESTFMAWLRTSISLIGFGFTITQFFARLRDMSGNTIKPMAVETPRDLGLVLIAAGVLGLIVAFAQYRAFTQYLRSAPYQAIAGIEGKRYHSPVFAAGIVMLAIGVAAFFAVLFRLA
jgi:putative membrane protein